MKLLSADIDTLHKLYVQQLELMLSAEQQIAEALPTMIEKSTDTQLKQAFQSHLQETVDHVTRLEDILEEETDEPKIVKAKAFSALIIEAEDLVRDATENVVRDVSLITAAQRVEHYEIAAYGALRTWAHILGKQAQAAVLDRITKEEGHADHLLTAIAERVTPAAERAA
jgi:ferritin-like metal-binding protein YciE